MSTGRGVATDSTFSTGMLASGLMLPAFPLGFGLIALVADAPIVGWPLLIVGVVIAALFATSTLRIEASVLTVRMLSLRRRSVALADVQKAYLEPAAPSLWQVPAIRLDDRDGRQTTVCLGWWRRESDFLAHLDDGFAAAGVRPGDDVRAVLRRRPSGWFWSLDRRQRRGPARARPFTRTGIDRTTYRIGLASVALGVVVTILALPTHAGIGSFRLVPAVVVGYQAVNLGAVAVLIARPARARRRVAGTVWLWLVFAILTTAATLVIALDALGVRIAPERGPLHTAGAVGGAFVTIGFGFVILWGGAHLLGIGWARFLRAGGAEWLR